MTKESFNEYIKPFLVLVCICLVVSFLLAFTNSKTAPIVEENQRLEAERTRQAVLPGSTTFTELDVSAIEGVKTAFRDDGGAGYVATAGYKGYGGEVVVTIGLDNDGKIVGISADVGSETTGIGSKAGQRSFLDKFMGMTGTVSGVDTITNATYSSTAVIKDATAILEAFEAIKGASAK